MHIRVTNLGVRDWDDVRVFLAIARAGSFQKAAEFLFTSQSTISRRIAELERRLGARLFERDNQGARLTPSGRVIQGAAESIERSVLDIERGIAGVDAEMRGLVTIATGEDLGVCWLAPRLLDLQRRNPGLLIRVATPARADERKGGADIALAVGRLEAPFHGARRVADLHLRPFGAKAYLREFGKPKSVADFARHHIVDRDPSPAGELWDNWARYVAASRGVVLRSNSAQVVARAVSEGYGLGLLPAFMAEMHPNLEEIPLQIGPPLALWIGVHQETGGLRRVRATLDHIQRLFEADRYRYFSP